MIKTFPIQGGTRLSAEYSEDESGALTGSIEQINLHILREDFIATIHISLDEAYALKAAIEQAAVFPTSDEYLGRAQ